MSFINLKVVKAIRKPKRCEGCGTIINAGERAVRYVGIEDGFYSLLYHPECRRAEVRLNAVHKTRWDDDWMSLANDMEWEDWPWLIEVCPVVAVRMKITTKRFEKVKAEREEVRLAWAAIDRARISPHPVTLDGPR